MTELGKGLALQQRCPVVVFQAEDRPVLPAVAIRAYLAA